MAAGADGRSLAPSCAWCNGFDQVHLRSELPIPEYICKKCMRGWTSELTAAAKAFVERLRRRNQQKTLNDNVLPQ